MSRADGSFPTYTKLDVSPDIWPSNYWDKARECTSCALRWPAAHIFEPSPCCYEPTNLVDGPPDMRWPDALQRMLHARFERYYDEFNEGVSDEQLGRIALEELTTNGEYDQSKGQEAVEQLLRHVHH